MDIKDRNWKYYDSGVYKIVNRLDNKCYVGIAGTLGGRYSTHRKHLLDNKHWNRFLQFAYNKYGVENFYFEVIELCEKIDLNVKEQYWMDFYKSLDHSFGYNLASAGGVCFGRVQTQEAKIKHTATKTKRRAEGKYINSYKHTWSNNGKSAWRIIDEYYNGIKTNTYESGAQAAAQHNVSAAVITNCCARERIKMTKLPGYYFRYANGGVVRPRKAPNKQ